MPGGRHRIIRLAETTSTNSDAMRLALAGEELPLWVVAERQTGGRGRSGRTWSSAPGNLQTSVAIASTAPLAQAGELALIAGVALIDAVRKISAAAPVSLKWPNDVLIGRAKAGGVLVESTTARGAPGFVGVIGFGLNVVSHPEDLSASAASLAAHGIATRAEDVLDALVDAMTRWVGAWDDGRAFASVIAPAWTERALAAGERIRVVTAAGAREGRFGGIDERGYLLLDGDDGTRHTVTHGDVSLDSAVGQSEAR